MDFPPVSELISSPFEQLNNKLQKVPVNEPKAPEAAVTPLRVGEASEKLGLNSMATNGTNRVGTVIDARA